MLIRSYGKYYVSCVYFDSVHNHSRNGSASTFVSSVSGTTSTNVVTSLEAKFNEEVASGTTATIPEDTDDTDYTRMSD